MSVRTGILELAPGEHERHLGVDYAIWHVCSKNAARPLGAKLTIKVNGVACSLPYMTGHLPIFVSRLESINVETSEDIELYIKSLADVDNLVHDSEREDRAQANQIINYTRAERRLWDIHS